VHRRRPESLLPGRAVTNTEGSDRWFTGGLEGVLPGAYRIARTLAGARLEHELDRLREAGAEADGEVVEPMPLDAIRKIASREEARRGDRLHPSAAPVALDRDGPPPANPAATSLPVTHVAGQAGPSV
jgi:hypothetical protein